MSQLRWTLLILGGVFIVGLVLWELLRPRQARGRDSSTGGDAPEAHVGSAPSQSPAVPPGSGRAGEPWIADEPLEAPVQPEVSWPEAALSDPIPELPPMRADEAHLSGPPGQPPAYAAEAPNDGWDALEEGVGPVRVLDTEQTQAVAASEGAREAVSERPSEGVPAAPRVGLPSEPALRVEWPPESEREIVAVRLVACTERFTGRTVRLALSAEGFQLGRFDIFHKPDEHGHALISVASLTRPGTFDPKVMDSHRYAGLNLFAVLPGPLPAAQAFEALLAVAANLNERLHGEVQDERGDQLSDERIAELRAALPGGAGEAAP